MTNYETGHEAEKVAAEYLVKHGYEVLALNWRHQRAEIDIVARKKGGILRRHPLIFFEVKHRRTAHQGNGLDYITPAKLRQMEFAASLWVSQQRYTGGYSLGAIELTGNDYRISAVLEQV